jgi:hypothetical protein
MMAAAEMRVEPVELAVQAAEVHRCRLRLHAH